jgi:hypothetical protein
VDQLSVLLPEVGDVQVELHHLFVYLEVYQLFILGFVVLKQFALRFETGIDIDLIRKRPLHLFDQHQIFVLIVVSLFVHFDQTEDLTPQIHIGAVQLRQRYSKFFDIEVGEFCDCVGSVFGAQLFLIVQAELLVVLPLLLSHEMEPRKLITVKPETSSQIARTDVHV